LLYKCQIWVVIKAFKSRYDDATIVVPDTPEIDIITRPSNVGVRIIPGNTLGGFYTRILKPAA